MSDDDLRAAIAAWETERARRWAPIERLKGAEHLAARAEYMEEKAAYDRMKAEATRRGLRRRTVQGRRASEPVEDIWCEVHADERRVSAKAAARAGHVHPAAATL